MLRNIIKIDEQRCNGCGLCVNACHEGAIALVDGKARLMRDDHCDGLGDCLPVCPTGAIAFEQRDTAPYDAQSVKRATEQATLPCGCPGTHAKVIERANTPPHPDSFVQNQSALRQWPVQMQLVPVNAPYFAGAHLLIAADCTAFAYADFHNQFMKNKITLMGCPKLDKMEYSEKLTAILKANTIESVTVVRMEVPCCGGIVHAVKAALSASEKMIPWQVITLSTDGNIL